jgi:hypothetical protein
MEAINPQDFPETIQECWAVHQAFRALGFSPDDIYVMVAKEATRPDCEAALFSVLKAQGHEFSVTLGLYSSEEAANADVAQWTEFVNMANGGAFSTDDLSEIYKESSIFENRVQFITALHNKGIRPSKEWS